MNVIKEKSIYCEKEIGLFYVALSLSISALILLCSLNCRARMLPHVTFWFIHITFKTIYDLFKFLTYRKSIPFGHFPVVLFLWFK